MNKMEKKALLYFQSGGPTSVINTSLYGVIREAQRHPDQLSGIYGSHHGVEGLINHDIFDLSAESDEEIEHLKQTPAAILGSSRKKLPSFEGEDFKKIIVTIKRLNIGYILVNGGNDSMDTCHRLSSFFKANEMDVKIIGIPKTVDNDLDITDHSIGFPSAARHIIDSAMMLSYDARVFQTGKVVIFEIMGRNAGWLTASVALLPKEARPDCFYIPEMSFDEGLFLKQIKQIYDKKRWAVVALSEGVPLDKHNNAGVDSFGHSSFEGVGETASNLIHQKLGFVTRVVSDTTLQRSDSFSVTKTDAAEAEAVGRFGVISLLKGKTGQMVVLKRLSSFPYSFECGLVDVAKVANVEKKIPSSWIKDNSSMSQDFLDYLTPLVSELRPLSYEEGILRVARFKFIKVK